MQPVSDPDEDDVPELACKALDEATRKGIEDGIPTVLIRDGWFVRIVGEKVERIRPAPPRVKVSQRVKYLRSDVLPGMARADGTLNTPDSAATTPQG